MSRKTGRAKLSKLKAVMAILAMLLGLSAATAVMATPAAAQDVLCSGNSYSSCIGAGYTDHGYSSHSGTSYWGAYSGHNCTNYVAYMESTQNGAPSPGNNLGNAKDWGANAAAKGYAVNSTPGLGSVAWWGANAGGSSSDGHVAYVEAINPNNGSIRVSEDVYSGGPFRWRDILPGDPHWPSGFIHFKDFPGTQPPQPPVVTDSDSDGIADNIDECTDIPGPDYQQGCRQQKGTFRGDFNADGKEDVASFYMYPERGSAMSLFVWDGNGDGTLKAPRLAYYDASGWGADRVIPAGSGDFNKDGHPDIAIFYRYPNTVVRTIVWYGHADGSFNMAVATVDNQMEGANLIPVGAGDYNGDGNADIAALYRYPERGNALSAIVWYGNSDGTLNPGQAMWYNATGWDGHLIVPIGSGDFFADGRTDFSVFYDYGGGVTRMLTWYGRADGTFYDPTVTFYASSGWAGRHLVPAGVGDFDGDGKDDVASFYGYPERGNAVSLYVWKGNGDGTFQAPHLSWYTASGWWWLNLIPFGVSDLNGDGRAETTAAYNYGGSVTRLFTWSPNASLDAADPSVQYYATDMAAVNLRP